MDERRIVAMTERVAQKELDPEADFEVDDEPLAMVDQAIDMMIRCVRIINENLPKVEIQNVPQKAALDETKKLMDEGVSPYLADVVKAMQAFEGGA
jgi:hypothetical protein